MSELHIGRLPNKQPPCLTKHIVAAMESGSEKSIAGDFIPYIGAGVLHGYCMQAVLNQCKANFTIRFEGQPPETIELSEGQYRQMLNECPVRTVDPI